MKYRQIGQELSIWRGHTESKGLLDRLMRELRAAFGDDAFTVVTRDRQGALLQERIVLRFAHAEGARSAEGWIEAHFDVS